MENSSNPLLKHFRQPALYVKLPSNGSYWPEGSLNMPLNNEIGIMPMSTLDEITLRTPDALLNGQGVVDVISSCCPAIIDPWQMPSIDVDTVIIAIRIASYGNEMDFSAQCPHCNTTHDYAINLSNVLSNIRTPNYSTKIEIDDLKIKLKPQAYYSVNRANMISFEEQQIIRAIEQSPDNPEEIKRIFNIQLQKINDLNIETLTGSTAYIELPDGTIVTDPKYIFEFYANCKSTVTRTVKDEIARLNLTGGIEPVEVVCDNKECEQKFKVSIDYDFSSFFAVGS